MHAPPRFVATPEDVIYVNLGDAIILTCQAEGTPTPEILWYKDANPVEPTATTGNAAHNILAASFRGNLRLYTRDTRALWPRCG